MPKGGNGNGGGGSGGGGKPGSDSGWTGTDSDDTFSLTSLDQLTAWSIDGKNGFDTLDLSGLTLGPADVNGIVQGVTLEVSNPSRPGQKGSSYVSIAEGFTGIVWTVDTISAVVGIMDASIKSMEAIIGTYGNDRLTIHDSDVNFIDGGAGNDHIMGSSGDTIIGGSGSDWLDGDPGSLVVGGNWSGVGLPTGDGESDWFLGEGIILDFELATETFEGDHLLVSGGDTQAYRQPYVDSPWIDTKWTDNLGVEHDAAALNVVGKEFILVGIDAQTANTEITIQFVISGTDSEGTSGDDIFIAINEPAVNVFDLTGGGDDLIVYMRDLQYSIESDALIFPENTQYDANLWAETNINGQDGFVYDYGDAGSVTVLGLTSAELATLDIQIGAVI